MMSEEPLRLGPPLSGVLVVELASNIAGPFTGLILRDLGARVVKIEKPQGGDDIRAWPPYRDGISAPFAALNRGKESVAVDVSTHAGRDVMHSLVARADVFVQSLRPGTADRLGLGSEALMALNRMLVYCSISGFGRSGPRGGDAGFDAIVQAYSGLMNLTGHPDGEPARVGTGVIDFGTGLWAAVGVLATLQRRAATQMGGEVEATLLGTGVGLMMHHIASVTMTGVVPGRAGTAQHNSAPYEAIRAKDALVMIGVTNESLWLRLCQALDCEPLLKDGRFSTNTNRIANRDDLVDLLSDAVAHVSAAEVVNTLRASGVPASEIRSIADLPDDEQVRAMGLVQTLEGGERLAASPVCLDGQPPDLSGVVVPTLGSATNTVLADVGYSQAELAEMRNAGIIGDGRGGMKDEL
jgi:CoA:oxalate CoA-transferase